MPAFLKDAALRTCTLSHGPSRGLIRLQVARRASAHCRVLLANAVLLVPWRTRVPCFCHVSHASQTVRSVVAGFVGIAQILRLVDIGTDANTRYGSIDLVLCIIRRSVPS